MKSQAIPLLIGIAVVMYKFNWFEVADRTHGIMVNPNVENGGKESDYLLSSPVSTAKHVIDFWGL